MDPSSLNPSSTTSLQDEHNYDFDSPSKDYKRPLSNAEIVPKFRIEATINEALKDVRYIKYVDGNYVNMDSYTKYDNFVIDWREIQTEESVNDIIYLLQTFPDQIYGIRFPGCRLPDPLIDQIMNVICDHGLLKYLVDVDFSYISLSQHSVKKLSMLLDPAVSGYCPIKRIQLCHCNLRQVGMQQIFEASKSNVFLNEMNLSGNNCSDASCVAIAKCLENPENQFHSLSIGENNISVVGLRTLCPGLSRHQHLKALLLSNNHFGDEGASVLVRALKKSGCVEELNMSNCGLIHCKWAKHLKFVSSLASLNISCNQLSDFGCLSICNGVQACPYLRHLDLSNNPFGGTSCSGLGYLLETHGGLYSLNVSYCTLLHSVWSSIAAGLSLNKALILLDTRWTNMTNTDAAILCQALEFNDIAMIDFSFNPVPPALFTNCRAHCPELRRNESLLSQQQQQQQQQGSAIQATGDSINVNSRSSSPVARPSTAATAATGTSGGSRPSSRQTTTAGTNRTAASRLGSSNNNQSKTGIYPLPLNENAQLLSLQSADEWREDALANLNILIAVQTFDESGVQHDLEDETEEDGLDALMKDDYVRIVYGNFQEEIGVIKIHASTTYAQARPLITPLIKSYLGAAVLAEPDSESIKALLYDFTFILKDGHALEGVSMQSRCMLQDAVLNEHTIIVRPGNWIKLSSVGGDDDDDSVLPAGVESV